MTGLSFSDVLLSADVDLTKPSVAVSEQTASAVKAAPVTNANGATGWAAIIPAQNVENLVITVQLSDGTSKVVEAGKVYLYEGNSIMADLTFEKAYDPDITFSTDITDWLEYEFYIDNSSSSSQGHTWAIMLNNGTLYPMTRQEGGLWTGAFAASSWVECYVAKDGGEQLWGSAIPDTSYWLDYGYYQEVLLAPNCPLYLRSDTGIISVTLDPSAKKLYVEAGEHEWEYMGTGKFIDGFVTDLFGFPHVEFEVDVYNDKNIPNVYRVMDPYKNWPYRDYFDYEDGAYLDFWIKDDGSAWIKKNYIGLSDPDYGTFTCGSIVTENSWSADSYGYYYDNYGYLRFYNYTVTSFSNYGNYTSNRQGMMGLTLPGGTRPYIYGGISIPEHNWEQDPDSPLFIEAVIKPGMDVTSIRYGVYAGHLASEEIFGKNRDGLCYTDVKVNGTELSFIPDYENTFRVEVPQHGTYTLVLYAENINGGSSGVFAHYWTWDGENDPTPSMSVTTEASDHFPDIEAMATINFQDPSEFYVAAVEEAAFTAAGLTDSDIYDYTLSYGEKKSNSYLSSNTGMLLRVQDLKPQTSYRIMVAGTTNYGQSAWAQASITTAAAPSFSSIGKGNYHDWFYNAFGADGNHSEVEILRADSNPNRYRVMDPYTEFWNANADSGAFSYAGFSAEYIDCLVDGETFIYAPYCIGFYEPDMGPLQYNCYYYGIDYVFGQRNALLQEGVYNIAPYAEIMGTRSYYNLSNGWGEIYLEMPGYTYDESANNAPRRAPRKTNLVEAPAPFVMAAQSEVLPLTRHMIQTTATVKAEVTPNFSAEPLK